MKKALLMIVCVIGVLLGALLIWKVVLPFLGGIFSWAGDTLKSLF